MKSTAQFKALGNIFLTLVITLFCCSVFAQQPVTITIENNSSFTLEAKGYYPDEYNNQPLTSLGSPLDSIGPNSSGSINLKPVASGLPWDSTAYLQYQINDEYNNPCNVDIYAIFDGQGKLTSPKVHKTPKDYNKHTEELCQKIEVSFKQPGT